MWSAERTCASVNWPASVWEWEWSCHWYSLRIGWVLRHVTVWPALIGCLLELPFFAPPPSPSPVPYAPLAESRSLSSVLGRLAGGSKSESRTYMIKHMLWTPTQRTFKSTDVIMSNGTNLTGQRTSAGPLRLWV